MRPLVRLEYKALIQRTMVVHLSLAPKAGIRAHLVQAWLGYYLANKGYDLQLIRNYLYTKLQNLFPPDFKLISNIGFKDKVIFL